MKLLKTLSVVVFISFLTISCGSSGGGGDNNDNGSSSTGNEPDTIVMGGPSPLVFSPVEGGSVSEEISAATGGTLITGTMNLEIPAGAFSGDTTVTMTVMRDTSKGDYTILGMFEPDGLVLNKPATLVIKLDPPLPEGKDLNLLIVDSLNPNQFVDTGLFADISEDRTEVRIPVEHFSGAGCADFNCHGHSVRNIVKALLTDPSNPRTNEQITGEVCKTVGDQDSSIKDANKKFLKLCDVVKQHYDKLSDFNECLIKQEELLAYLTTFYTLSNIQVDSDYSGDLLKPEGDCLENLEVMTKSSVLPPILNFSMAFKDNFSSVPHSAPLVLRANNVVFENGLSINKDVADALQAARDSRNATNEIPQVAAVELRKLDEFRQKKSGQAVNEELERWGASERLSGSHVIPWAAVRIWVPKGEDPGLCDLDLEFPVTYTGSGWYQSSISFDFGEKQFATCGAASDWTVTLYADGTLSTQWEITETSTRTPTLGKVECFTYDEPAVQTRWGTHSNGHFEWVESIYGLNRNLKGVYDSSNLKTDPLIWSNSWEQETYDFGDLLGIQSWTTSKSLSLTKQN